MKAKFFALAVVAAGLAGCATDPAANKPGPAYEREIEAGRPGLFGDLRWNIDLSGQWEPVRGPGPKPEDRAEFMKWRDSLSPSERQEFEEWRAWQEWKRKNPK